MKIELNNNNKCTTIADLGGGDTFLHPSTDSYDRDSIFIVVADGWTNRAIDLENGEEITLDENEIVIPIKVKIVPDT